MKPLAPVPPNAHPDARRIPASAARSAGRPPPPAPGRHPVRLNLLPLLCFFAPGLLGMALMMVSTLHLSSADPKANWLEQEGSGAAQPCFFLGLTLLPCPHRRALCVPDFPSPAGAFSMRQIIRFTYVNHFKPILPLCLRCAYNKLLFEKTRF